MSNRVLTPIRNNGQAACRICLFLDYIYSMQPYICTVAICDLDALHFQGISPVIVCHVSHSVFHRKMNHHLPFEV